jgi:hypothetical protein
VDTPDIRTMPAGEPFDLLAGWKPARRECHDNVDRWVVRYPEARAVLGWRHEESNVTTHWFVAHSVPRAPAGPIDVTIPSSEPKRPFI